MEVIMTAVLAALIAGTCVLVRDALKRHMFVDMSGGFA